MSNDMLFSFVGLSFGAGLLIWFFTRSIAKGGFFVALGLGMTFSGVLIVVFHLNDILAFFGGIGSVVGLYIVFLKKWHPKLYRELGRPRDNGRPR